MSGEKVVLRGSRAVAGWTLKDLPIQHKAGLQPEDSRGVLFRS